MDCPRCKLGLTDMIYEGEAVKYCGTCWGYWMRRRQLDKIVDGAMYKFSKKESKQIRRTLKTRGDVDRQGNESGLIDCPSCKKVMERKKFHYQCPVEIDECTEHGIWLDTGEIKELQIFIEQHVV